MSFENATSLSIRVRPNSPDNVKAFGLPGVEETGFRAGEFVGSIDEGGYLNCKILTIAPHGMGTHTESVRHIVSDGPPVCDVVPHKPFRIRLLTISPETLGSTRESYAVGDDADLVITKSALQAGGLSGDVDGLVIRTTGGALKTGVDYTSSNPAYFTSDAMKLIGESVDHLLVDLPSVDRESDEGLLLNHRSFWNVGDRETLLSKDVKVERSITEMIYVPDHLSDGDYWCLVAVPDIDTDALPSRVLLYK